MDGAIIPKTEYAEDLSRMDALVSMDVDLTFNPQLKIHKKHVFADGKHTRIFISCPAFATSTKPQKSLCFLKKKCVFASPFIPALGLVQAC